jgi:hypothetical protein
MSTKVSLRASILLGMSLLLALLCAQPARGQAPNPAPPAQPVKLIFIHHSTGGNWLADPNSDQPSGGLGIALRDSNYYVSATNYGWGPDGIGDRTDIPNWPEWFAGPESERYLKALYTEKGQNIGDFGRWSRMSKDPGGENEIIVFKSCFPNSDLYGNPGDAASAEPNDELTVSNAKAVYNRLLTYFATRQDKLFVVITAPPMADFDYGAGSPSPAQRAANARAFNEWLVNEWLAGYPHANVAVFDYYNVLTSSGGNPDSSDLDQEGGNHHRWRNGQIEHTRTVDNDFSSYPSGDSHPSSAGQRKAAAEFVPLLNIFYHRWKEGAGAAAPASPAPTKPAQPTAAPAPTEAAEAAATEAPQDAAEPTAATAEEPAPPAAAIPKGVIANWEGENTWQCNEDGQGSTIQSAVDDHTTDQGIGALRITYKLVANGWSDCGTSFASVADWSSADGLALALHADKAGQPLVVVLFSGAPDAYTPFVASLETAAESVSGWTYPTLPWDRFARADWADQGGIDKLDPSRVVGMALNFTQGEGTIWLDEVALFTGQSGAPTESQTAAPMAEKEQPTATPAPTEGVTTAAAPEATVAQDTPEAARLQDTPEPTSTARSPGTPCASAFVLPLTLVCVAFARRRQPQG